MIIVPFCKCIVITREFKKEDGSVCVELCLTFKKGVVIECVRTAVITCGEMDLQITSN